MLNNKKKTKLISFNKSRKWDFPPELKFSDGTIIEYKPEMKIVGVILSENLSWFKNTQYICDKARQKLWIIRRMLQYNLNIETMFDVYIKEVRSILELAVPVWHSGLTRRQSSDIERIQKIAFKIILGVEYKNYDQACKMLSTQTLEDRRTKLCLKFARKNLKSENSLFTELQHPMNTRWKANSVQEFKCRTERFKNSSLPYLARLLNQDLKARKRRE